MNVILNEFSLEEQFDSPETFLESLKSIIKVQHIMDVCSFTLLKHQELYNYKVTENRTLHEILIDKRISTGNEGRKFKIFLKKLMSDPPFWQDNQRHLNSDRYICDYTHEVSGYSLAEACERDKIVLSFDCGNFREAGLIIKKNGQPISLLNINDPKVFADYLLEMKKIGYHEFCNTRFENQNISFSKLESSYDFNMLEEEEANTFISTFKYFSEMTWDEIQQSNGLEFKKYQPASRKDDWFANSSYEDKQIFKFRTSQKYRCFGYREGNVFFVLRFEVDHLVSDKG
ncbi:hypothetical protein OPHB3_3085 [Oceanobacillus picturae]|uniref:Uncharacterized protein n=1 Tax=Oceanobacillus picturae TaxID=171693 RepID=A0A0U9HH47_9BACI|nr:hypothetical protein [Oceanobacillus picturae]GAQ19126.1 hypothetical protein OPHB3_3085 [Oceanobacillus picturae]